MFYTGAGDGGLTTTFGCDQKISKSSAVAEALGSLDEINSLLGLPKVAAEGEINAALEAAQQTLFIIQAELAGAEKTVPEERVRDLEKLINEIEKSLPPITTFFVSGGTALAAQLDFARTVARRAERRVVAVAEERPVGKWTLAYLNRLSSALYALARLANHKSGIKEQPPRY